MLCYLIVLPYSKDRIVTQQHSVADLTTHVTPSVFPVNNSTLELDRESMSNVLKDNALSGGAVGGMDAPNGIKMLVLVYLGMGK